MAKAKRATKAQSTAGKALAVAEVVAAVAECDKVSHGQKSRPELVRPSHGHGKLTPAWTSETAPRNGGAPKGFVPPTQAYLICSSLPPSDLRRLVAGEMPESKLWPRNREVTSGYAAMAGQILAAMTGATPAAREYADRVEGPVTQRVESLSASYLVELPAVAPEAAVWAAARSAPRLAAAIAQADGDGGGADHA